MNDKKTIKNSPEIVEDEVFATNYATRQELNNEATLRANGDQVVMDEFELLRRRQNTQIDDLNAKVTSAEGQIQSNNVRLDDVEGSLRDQINRLEAEKATLNDQLATKDKTIAEKDQVISDLVEEIAINNDPNNIHLTFKTVPQFTLTTVMSVKQFINTQLKELIVSRMQVRYPNASFPGDYTIKIFGLAYVDVMQGKNMTVQVESVSGGKLVGDTEFDIIVIYNYDVNTQLEFLEQFFQRTIPVSLRNVAESAAPDYNVPNEITNTEPLKLLIYHPVLEQLPFKIGMEVHAGSYFSDFHHNWQFNLSGYVGTAPSTIGGSTLITSVLTLYNNTTGYHNSIYNLIQQRLEDSGVPCEIIKKWVHNTRGDWLFHTMGNLTFNIPNVNLDDDDVSVTQSRNYYICLNFAVTLDINQQTNFYRSVTLFLTDNLELY